MSKFNIFSVLGIEIEYMVVDHQHLDVQPKADLILKALGANLEDNEVSLGDISVSNEFVLHVIELKNNGPKPFKAPFREQFNQAIQKINPLLQQLHLKLLPTGAHPWMNPERETHRWPHGNKEIYEQYDIIFNCHGHGWANLQSMHVNFPFANDDEFSHLHNLIRLILPLLPALAASTPILNGKITGLLDTRLSFYGKNQQRIPSISGQIIPEFITTPQEYQDNILAPMYRDIASFDPQGILQYEWLNSRAAIPKFEYGAIEIRILDSQECVTADIAIAKAIFAILKNWYDSGSYYYLDHPCEQKTLKVLFDQTIIHGMSTIIEDSSLFAQWQLKKKPRTCLELWSLLIEEVCHDLDRESQLALEYILSQGNLSSRLMQASGLAPNHQQLITVYDHLAQCLIKDEQFKLV